MSTSDFLIEMFSTAIVLAFYSPQSSFHTEIDNNRGWEGILNNFNVIFVRDSPSDFLPCVFMHKQILLYLYPVE